MLHSFSAAWAARLSYKKSFDSLIIIYVKLEAENRSIIFNIFYALSKLPYFTP